MSDEQLEIERLRALAYAPGLWRCPKCNFTLLQKILDARTGAVGTNDKPGERCPNCDSSLWRVTERENADEMAQRCEEAIARARSAEQRIAELEALINTPHVDEWFEGVRIEAAHQIERWGSEHDAGKSALDWFWLIGYLAQKAVAAASAGDDFKAKHHTISTGAALLNWYRRMVGDSSLMRPGLSAAVQKAAEARSTP